MLSSSLQIFSHGKMVRYSTFCEVTLSSKDIAFCHIVSLVPFKTENGGFYSTGYEMAVGIVLDLSHVNEGNGTFVPEVEGLNERCNIRFTTEFIGTLNMMS